MNLHEHNFFCWPSVGPRDSKHKHTYMMPMCVNGNFAALMGRLPITWHDTKPILPQSSSQPSVIWSTTHKHRAKSVLCCIFFHRVHAAAQNTTSSHQECPRVQLSSLLSSQLAPSSLRFRTFVFNKQEGTYQAVGRCVLQRVLLLSYDKGTKRIQLRHYSISAQPSGVSKSVKALVSHRALPDMGAVQDVSEFLSKSGYGSVSLQHCERLLCLRC